jgi:hypothetical protein
MVSGSQRHHVLIDGDVGFHKGILNLFAGDFRKRVRRSMASMVFSTSGDHLVIVRDKGICITEAFFLPAADMCGTQE